MCKQGCLLPLSGSVVLVFVYTTLTTTSDETNKKSRYAQFLMEQEAKRQQDELVKALDAVEISAAVVQTPSVEAPVIVMPTAVEVQAS